MTPEEQNRQQFHDVNRPGHGGPTPTSRPVIVGHRPTMPDPMVNQRPAQHPADQLAKPALPNQGAGSSIDGFRSPLTPHNSLEPTLADGTMVAGEPLQSPPFDPSMNYPPVTHPHHHQTNHENDSLFQGQARAGEHSQVSQSGLASKRSKWWAPVVILFFLLIGLYLAIDSGLIHTNINLPFHLFPQAEPPIYTPYIQ